MYQHFRNFQTELKHAKDVNIIQRFQELSPKSVAKNLFGHVRAGDKIAITTRKNNAITKEYVQAIIEKQHEQQQQSRQVPINRKIQQTSLDQGRLPYGNLENMINNNNSNEIPIPQVRVITGQSATEDFCFLKETSNELIGMRQSSFFHWAAYLGRSPNVRAYSIVHDNGNDNDNDIDKKSMMNGTDGDLLSEGEEKKFYYRHILHYENLILTINKYYSPSIFFSEKLS